MSLSARIPEAARSRLVPNPAALASAAVSARSAPSFSGESAGNGDALYALARVTDAVVIVNLLMELGVGEKWVLRALCESREPAFTCSLPAKHFGATH